MRTAQSYLDDAAAVVKRLPAAEAVAIHAKGDGVFIDVRDTAAIQRTGTIAGATCIPRGFIEFAADTEMGFHNPVLQKDADIYLVCGLGGQAALSGKTLVEMGYNSVTNIGGIGDWKDAGGPMEEV